MLNEVVLIKRSVQYLYPDDTLHVFMDRQDYSQYMIESDAIQDELIWITDGMEGLVDFIIKHTQKILAILVNDGQLTIKEMAVKLSISDRAVKNHLRVLKDENRLVRVGSDRGGYLEIIEN